MQMQNLDTAFSALADPTRRAILARLTRPVCSHGIDFSDTLPDFLFRLQIS